MLSSPRSPSSTMRILSSAEKCRRVARRMVFSTCIAGSFTGPDFCLIFAPRKATMSQKSSLPQPAESVSRGLTADSDLLTGSGSRLDIQNINLLATLLVHAQYQGYWNQLGIEYQEEMEALLEWHVLSGLVDAPWVRTDDPESDDDGFFAALQELVAYAFEESVRIKKKGRLFPDRQEIPLTSCRGILQEVQSLLQKYRSELVRRSRLLDQGGR